MGLGLCEISGLNAFLVDVYQGREILRAGRIPEALILMNEGFRPEMQDFMPVHDIAGIAMVWHCLHALRSGATPGTP